MLKSFDENVTKEDFLNSGWGIILSTCDKMECYCYSSRFLEAIRIADEASDNKRYQILLLLGCLTSLMPKLDTPEEPYAPCFVFHDGRSAIVDDFDDTHLRFLADILRDITDPELQARLADILWLRTKDYRYGEIAVAAYLASAKLLEDFSHWTSSVHRLERAMQIAAPLGRNTSSYKNVVEHVENLLTACNGEDPLYMSLKLMGLLLDQRQGETTKYAPLAEKLAHRAEAENDWEKARQHWEIKARWHAKNGDRESERLTRITAAEAYVKHAEWILNSEHPQNLVAAHWMQCAVEAMRRISNTKERTLELHGRLLDYQQKAVSELKPISHSIDISELATVATRQVTGKALLDALLALAMLGSSPEIAQLRVKAIEHREEFDLLNLFPRTFVNAAGRAIAKQPQDEEERLRGDMWRDASLSHGIHVQAFVEPARQQILLEHYIRLADFAPFVVNSPFVRPGREQIVGRALYMGLQGDMLTATHLLIPQIEDSVRFILFHKGVITSGLDKDGIQDEYNLNKMLTTTLYTEPLSEVLGEDFVFDLRGLLIERFGANLRNDMAHGLITHDAFYSHAAHYLWWLALRFYAWPTVLNLRTEASDEDPD